MTTHLIGGAGFIGTSIIQALKARGKTDITVIDSEYRLNRGASLMRGIESIEIGRGFGADLQNVFGADDEVLHLAWTSQPASSMDRLSEGVSNNILASIELFKTAIDSGVRKIIFASSGGTVYGETPATEFNESHPLAPVSGYGAAKAATELYLSMLSATEQVNGISLRIGNPFGTYQLNGTPIGIFANFILCALEGRSARVFGDGSIVRDYIEISDVADAFVLALERDIASGPYNIGSQRGISINEVIEILNRYLPNTLEIEYIDARNFDVEGVILNSNKFRTATGWTPKRSIENGVSDLVRFAVSKFDQNRVPNSSA